MYGRKIKVLKKKSKTSGVKSNDKGSSWGPRIALYEREREQATYQILQKHQIQPSTKHHQVSSTSSASVSNQSHQSATYAHHFPRNPNSNGNRTSNHPSNGTTGSSNTESGTLSPDTSIANSSHRPPGSAVTVVGHYGSSILSVQKQQQQQQQQQEIYSRRLSSNNPNDNLSKPLTVIIPPPGRFNLSSDFGPDIDSSLPSTKTWLSSPDKRADVNGGLEDASTATKGSSSISNLKGKASAGGSIYSGNNSTDARRPSPVPTASAHHDEENYSRRPIKLSHSKPKDEESHISKHKMQKSSKDLYGSTEGLVTIQNPRVDGSAITALAQGIAMVYVPMESYSTSNSTSSTNPTRIGGSKSPEEQAVDNLNEMIDGKRDVYSSSNSSSSNESDSHQFSHVQQLPSRDDDINNNNKDPDVDSLLESFDSIMFKPKSALKSHGSSSHGYDGGHPSNLSCSSSSSSSSTSATMDPMNVSAIEKSYVISVPLASSSSTSSAGAGSGLTTRPKQQISESPPPLPPPNRNTATGTTGNNSNIHSSNKARNKPDKNLRFSEHLENFEFESLSSEKVNSCKKYQMNPNPDTVSQYSQAQSQLDTQSVSTEFVPDHHHQHQHSHSGHHHPSNGHSFSNNSNTILSCGHMKTCSNYSTLSSITSSLTDEEQTVRDPRSAIQQLRDLSLLIGGHFSPSSNSNSTSNNSNPKKLKSKSKSKLKQSVGIGKSSKENTKLRRDSDGSTDSSSRENSSGTDSGQCSGSGQSPTDTNSPKGGKISNSVSISSYPSSSCVFGKGDCEDCFTVFKNPLADSSHSHSSSCSTGTSRISPLLTTIIANEHHSSSSGGGGGGQQNLNQSQNRCDQTNSSHHQSHSHGHRHRHLIIQDQNQKSRSRLNKQPLLEKTTILSGQPIPHVEAPRNPLIYGSGGGSLSHHSSGHSSHGSKKSKKPKKHKRHSESLVLEYCDCSHCDCEARRGHSQSQARQKGQEDQQMPNLLHQNHQHRSGKSNAPSEMNSSGNGNLIGNPNGHGNCSSSNHTKRNPGTCHNHSNSSASISNPHSQLLSTTNNNAAAMNNNSNNNNNNLFTIDEEEFDDGIAATGKLMTDQNSNEIQGLGEEENSPFLNVAIKDFNSDEGEDHWHPKCWLATDPTMGWSDLESLYSQNMKLDKPISMNDECWTCWKELAENRPENRVDANRTVDRTKRMFIWLNRRHKEFNAPWWEAKKQASIRWLITKAFAHLPKESIGDPFKESRKGKPKYRLKDEVIKGLVSGKLYCLTLDHLYENSANTQYTGGGGLTHWDIIKILSRRGIYVAQPSDMKLTEGTLRQKKPLRIAAHIALIEAIMGLYCKETLNRDRIIATLNSLGQSVDPEISSAEQLVISWINATLLTLKSYIRSNKHLKLPCGRLNRWLNVPQVHEIRDLCDGIGICSLFALYCSNDVQLSEIAVPETDELLNMYETIANHTIIQRLCQDLFPEMVYHLCITDFLYIHGYMKQNILCFLVDLFHHLEINPVLRVNRLTHLPIRIEL